MGISRRFMLKKNKEFVYIYRRGKTVSSGVMLLAFVPNKSASIKFGFSVSRKVGGSVVRNRIKRLMRESVRLNISEFNPGFRYIFTARIPLKDADFMQVQKAILYLVKKAGLLNDNNLYKKDH